MQWKVDFMSFGKYLLKLKQNSRNAPPAMFGRHAWLPHNKDGGRRDPATNPSAHLFGLEIGGIRKDTQSILYFICNRRRPRPALKIHIYLKRFRTRHKYDSKILRILMVLACEGCGDFPATFVSFHRPPISVRQPGPGVVNTADRTGFQI